MSVSMETLEDEDDQPVIRNLAPRKKTRVLELADGSDDDDDVLSVPGRKKVSIYIH
jgi:hypothetical protein